MSPYSVRNQVLDTLSGGEWIRFDLIAHYLQHLPRKAIAAELRALVQIKVIESRRPRMAWERVEYRARDT